MSKTPLKGKIPPILRPHCEKYRKCRRCLIGCISDDRVYFKGAARCDILFVGDAPNDTDIAIGEPFSDPVGKLLDTLIHESGLSKYKITFTNTILCTPSESRGGKLRKPKAKELDNCSSRLLEFIRLVKPKQIVAVGSIAERVLKKDAVDHIKIVHPREILAQDENGNIDIARVLHAFKKVKASLCNTK